MNLSLLEGIRKAATTKRSLVGAAPKSNSQTTPKTRVGGGKRTQTPTDAERIHELEKNIDRAANIPVKTILSVGKLNRLKGELKELKALMAENVELRNYNVADLPLEILHHFEGECASFQDAGMKFMGRWTDTATPPPLDGALPGCFYLLDETEDWYLFSANHTWERLPEIRTRKTPWGKQVNQQVLVLKNIRRDVLEMCKKGHSVEAIRQNMIKSLSSGQVCEPNHTEKTAILDVVDARHKLEKDAKSAQSQLSSLKKSLETPDLFFATFKGLLEQSTKLRTRKLQNIRDDGTQSTPYLATIAAYRQYEAGVKNQLISMYPNVDRAYLATTFDTHLVKQHREELLVSFPEFDTAPKEEQTLEGANKEILRLTALLQSCGGTTRPSLTPTVSTSLDPSRSPSEVPVVGQAVDLVLSAERQNQLLRLQIREMEAKYRQQIQNLESRYSRLLVEWEQSPTVHDKITLSTKMTKMVQVCGQSDTWAIADLSSRFYNQQFTFAQHWVSVGNVTTVDQVIRSHPTLAKVLVVRPVYRESVSTKMLTSAMKSRITQYINQHYIEIPEGGR